LNTSYRDADSSERTESAPVIAKAYSTIGDGFQRRGDFASAHTAYALALANSPGDNDLIQKLNDAKPPSRNPALAAIMSGIIPGSGLAYSGYWVTGALAFGGVALLGYWAYSSYAPYTNVRDSVAALGTKKKDQDKQSVTNAEDVLVGGCALTLGVYIYQIFASFNEAQKFNAKAPNDSAFKQLFTYNYDPMNGRFSLGIALRF
jgi:hypothetical protein